MKKTAAILLFSLLAFNLAGVYLAFAMQQQQVKREIKQRIKQSVPEEELTVISLSPEGLDNLVWIKKNREFLFEGTMYDVVRSSAGPDGGITYYCISDIKETLLFAQLGLLEKQHRENGAGTPVKKVFQQYLSQVYLPVTLPPLAYVNSLSGAPSLAQAIFRSFATDVPSPPPKKA